MIVYVIQKIGGDKNSPNYLNIMVNYHYHGQNRIITRKFSSIVNCTRREGEQVSTDEAHEFINNEHALGK